GEAVAQLDEGLHDPDAGLDALDRAGHPFDPAEVPGRVLPAVGAGEVDDLAGGEERPQRAAGLLLDLLPGAVGDRGEFSVQMAHRLSAPSPQAADAEAGAVAAAAAAAV